MWQQIYIFLVFLLIGFSAKLVECFIKNALKMAKNNVFLVFGVDFVVYFMAGLICFFNILKLCNGVCSIVIFIAFAIGILCAKIFFDFLWRFFDLICTFFKCRNAKTAK